MALAKFAVVGVLLLLLVTPVLAGSQPFTYEQTGWRSSPPDDPCYEEDDGATFAGYGRVGAGFTFAQTLLFCSGEVGPGGVGFFFLLVANRDFSAQIVSPSGMSWPLTIERMKGDQVVTACVGDDHGLYDGVRSGTIEPGEWRIAVTYSGGHSTLVERLMVEVGMQNDQPGDPGGCVF